MQQPGSLADERPAGDAAVWADAARLLESALGQRGARRQRTLAAFVRDRMEADACQIIVRPPQQREYVEVANLDYSSQTASALERLFPQSKWIRALGEPWLPPSVSSERSQAFRKGAFYRNHLEAVGFGDGISAPIGDRRHPHAIVHLSSAGEEFFGEPERTRLATLVPVIDAYLAPLRQDDALRPGGRADLVIRLDGDTVVTAVGDELPAVLREPRSQEVLTRFLRIRPLDGGQEEADHGFAADLRGLISLGGVWHQCRREGIDGAVVRALPSLPAGLTARELDVLTLVARGESDAEIGERLSISPRTVHAHMRNLMAKLDCSTRTRLAIRALRAGWCDLFLLLPGDDATGASAA